LLLCVCAILPAKTVPEMTYNVSDETLNPTHSLTHCMKPVIFHSTRSETKSKTRKGLLMQWETHNSDACLKAQ